jgi:glycosyltransferase involved in cell wall biosynthesis
VKVDDFKVSVAMCTLNGAAFVEAQLDSILAQSRLPDEIVLCDDGSTDGTPEIAERFAQKYPNNFRIIRNERKLGYCRNFESAVRQVTGDIIFFCDQDDVWFPDKVASMVRVFVEDPNVVVAYSDAVLTNEELQPTGTVFERRTDAHLRTPPTLRQLSQGVAFNGPMMAFHARLKPFVIPFSPLSLQWGHDHWIAFIAYAVGEIGVINRPLVYYRRHGTNSGKDAELDGGLLYQWRVVKKKYAGLGGIWRATAGMGGYGHPPARDQNRRTAARRSCQVGKITSGVGDVPAICHSPANLQDSGSTGARTRGLAAFTYGRISPVRPGG